MINLYSEWRINRIHRGYCPKQVINACLDNLFEFSESDLCYSLCRFVREVKKLDGNDYLPNTLREIVIMIQMYLHSNAVNWKLLDGNHFVSL